MEQRRSKKKIFVFLLLIVFQGLVGLKIKILNNKATNKERPLVKLINSLKRSTFIVKIKHPT